jgi:hypothetical protein
MKIFADVPLAQLAMASFRNDTEQNITDNPHELSLDPSPYFKQILFIDKCC